MLVLAALVTPPARADVVFNVDTVADQIDLDGADGVCLTSSGTCSLRAAIMQANRLSGPVTTRINLPAGLYLLTRPVGGLNDDSNGDLNLTTPSNPAQSVFITGASAATTIIDANQIDRIMFVEAMRTVSISRVTLRNGISRSGGGAF